MQRRLYLCDRPEIEQRRVLVEQYQEQDGKGRRRKGDAREGTVPNSATAEATPPQERPAMPTPQKDAARITGQDTRGGLSTVVVKEQLRKAQMKGRRVRVTPDYYSE